MTRPRSHGSEFQRKLDELFSFSDEDDTDESDTEQPEEDEKE